MTGRRSYPKGTAKREELLATALEVIAERGYNKATLRDLADAANLSITGLVHHFGTREGLLTAVLRRRDEADTREYYAKPPETADAMIDNLERLVSHNAAVPGLVRLYTNLAADAAEPEHPAHEYFEDRYQRSLRIGREMLAGLQDRGELRQDVDVDDLAVLLMAAVDGLQLLWQYNPEIDMARCLSVLGPLLTGEKPGVQEGV